MIWAHNHDEAFGRFKLVHPPWAQLIHEFLHQIDYAGILGLVWLARRLGVKLERVASRAVVVDECGKKSGVEDVLYPLREVLDRERIGRWDFVPGSPCLLLCLCGWGLDVDNLDGLWEHRSWLV